MTRSLVLFLVVLALVGARPAAAIDRPSLAPAALHGSPGDALPGLEPGLARTQLVCAGGTALVATPLAMLAGTLVGRLSNDLVLAALPAALVYLLVPPAAAAWAAHAVASRSSVLSPGFWGPFALGVALHLAITAAAVVLFGVSSGGLLGAAVLSVIDAAAIGPAISWSMNALATPKSAESPPTLEGARAALALPILSGSF